VGGDEPTSAFRSLGCRIHLERREGLVVPVGGGGHRVRGVYQIVVEFEFLGVLVAAGALDCRCGELRLGRLEGNVLERNLFSIVTGDKAVSRNQVGLLG